MHIDNNLAIPDPTAGPAVYREYARQWLRANLPEHMRSDNVNYRTPTLDECRDWEASMYKAGLAGIPEAITQHSLLTESEVFVGSAFAVVNATRMMSSLQT